MTKILIISVGKLSGGIEKYTLTLEKFLRNGNYEIYFAVRENGWLSKQLTSNRVLRLKMDRIHLISSMYQLKKYVEKNNISIIHCNSNNALFISLFIKADSKTKKIAVIHGDVMIDQIEKGKIISNLYKILEISLVKRCNGCIAVSKSMKNILIDRGIPSNMISVIYSGVNTFNYGSLPQYNSTSLAICTIGNLLPSKNQIFLLESLNELKKRYPDILFECDIYGTGAEKVNLERYIEETKLKEVSLKGFDTNVREKLNQYSIYIQPSLYESFGIAVIEAMCAGCCVIVNSVGGLTEIINGNNGYIISCEDKNAVVEIIKYCYEHRDEIEQKGKKGKEYAMEMFSVETMINRLFNYYKTIRGEF